MPRQKNKVVEQTERALAIKSSSHEHENPAIKIEIAGDFISFYCFNISFSLCIGICGVYSHSGGKRSKKRPILWQCVNTNVRGVCGCVFVFMNENGIN